jgi:hypothetical protein
MIARRWATHIATAVTSAGIIGLCLATSSLSRSASRATSISDTSEPAISGNPLWVIPRESLTATRERPIFRPSRRPPPAALAAAPVAPQSPPPAPEAQPALRLLGIVIGATEGFAVFISETTQNIIRLKTGEGHEGWILRSVKAREAVLEKNHRSAVIELPLPMADGK